MPVERPDEAGLNHVWAALRGVNGEEVIAGDVGRQGPYNGLVPVSFGARQTAADRRRISNSHKRFWLASYTGKNPAKHTTAYQPLPSSLWYDQPIVRRRHAMTDPGVLERIEALEHEVERLKRDRSTSKAEGSQRWKRIVGVYRDNPDFDEAEQLGREWRESFRPQGDEIAPA